MLKRILLFLLCLSLLASSALANEWESELKVPKPEKHRNIKVLPHLAEGQPDWKSIPDLAVSVENGKLYFRTASGEPDYLVKNIKAAHNTYKIKSNIRWDKQKKAYALDLSKIDEKIQNHGLFTIEIKEPLDLLETANKNVFARRMEYQYYAMSGKLRKASYVVSLVNGNFHDEYYLDYFPNVGYLHRLQKLFMKKKKVAYESPMYKLGRYDLEGNYIKVEEIIPSPNIEGNKELDILDFPEIEFLAGALGGNFTLSTAEPLQSAVLFFGFGFQKNMDQRIDSKTLQSKKISKKDLQKISQLQHTLNLSFELEKPKDSSDIIIYQYQYSNESAKEYAEDALKAKKSDGFSGESFLRKPQRTYQAFLFGDCDLLRYHVYAYEDRLEVHFYDILEKPSVIEIYPRDGIE